jgi:hypothetical protein
MSYQPIVIEKANEIISVLEESNFFNEFELESTDFAFDYLCDKITKLFILGEVDLSEDNLFNEAEFEQCLQEIVAGTILYELKEKGLVNSYSDDVTEEIFFLTEKGKNLLDEKDTNQ